MKVKNLLKSADDKPRDILYTSIKSALFLLSSKDNCFCLVWLTTGNLI